MGLRIAQALVAGAAALCAGNWSEHGGKCYQAFGQSSGLVGFDAAEARCKSYGGHLATSNSREENEFLEDLCESRLPIGGCWIGLTDKGRPVKDFVWSDGSPYSGAFQAWIDHGGPGNMEPNNDFCTNQEYYTKGGCKYGETADCVLLISLMHKSPELHRRHHWNGRWMDTFCGSQHKYVCERVAMGRQLHDQDKEPMTTEDGHHVYEIFANATGSSDVAHMQEKDKFHFHPHHGKRKHVEHNETRQWEADELVRIANETARLKEEDEERMRQARLEADKARNASLQREREAAAAPEREERATTAATTTRATTTRAPAAPTTTRATTTVAMTTAAPTTTAATTTAAPTTTPAPTTTTPVPTTAAPPTTTPAAPVTTPKAETPAPAGEGAETV